MSAVQETLPVNMSMEGLLVGVNVPVDAIFQLAVRKWFEDRGDENLLQTANLDQDSIVVDVGGYTGVWAGIIHKKYAPKLLILEPVSKFFSILTQEFSDKPNISLFQYGLGLEGQYSIGLSSDGTSIFGQHAGLTENISIKSFDQFVAEAGIDRIDLLQINIEGGEYDLLPQILNHPIIHHIRRIQIQYHINKVSNCVAQRASIRDVLGKTHRETFNYPFVWEGFELLD